jgi:hypothetical protein
VTAPGLRPGAPCRAAPGPDRVPRVMKRGIKLTAVATLVVVALTGFTTGRSHGHSKSRSSSSGGGCSSSSQSHDSTSSRVSKGGSGSSYTRHTRHRSTTPSSSASSSLRDATVKRLKCADAHRAYALVSVTNPNSRQARFDVRIGFLGTDGRKVADGRKEVEVPARSTLSARVPVGSRALAADVDYCAVSPYAVPLR